jgi:dTDP-glucose pyrophosphorylase
MQIVIPMAGRGSRFVEKGYKEPKPFINVEGVPMIERVVKNLNIYGTYTFICLEEFWYTHYERFIDIMDKNNINFNVVLTPGITEGAACTILLAKKYINNDQELILANCDQIVKDYMYMTLSARYFESKKADGGILCFLAEGKKWSYAEVKEERIIRVAEKDPISNLATVGIYYFKRGSDFVQAAEQMIAKNIRVNNEFYTCPVFNELIGMSKMVLPYMVNEMWGIGTPEDLEIYLRRNDDKTR